MSNLVTNWPGQIGLIVAISVVLFGLKRVLRRVWPAHLMLIDFWPPFLIVFTHFLTQQTTDSSIVPYEIISLMIMGIGLTLLTVIQQGEILYGRFFKLFWRVTDLLTIVVYLLALVIVLIAK
ncbi:DUF3397 domain-containing protein [Lactiplantibacillus sp. WILCCON 0030]|uniref:DUF3397 domain-containing protein n=1 Tax=Lactiplantibacillus brownii TaxID=3069269 RepID=A0ABU1A9J4_9LACO|nr:DUF3397 domain-containing protein [Lactiplantibacillus brownii]MDQ7937637.1 DUF3397 domain-containing protein [Lactiplantibacillus brownii]